MESSDIAEESDFMELLENCRKYLQEHYDQGEFLEKFNSLY